VLAKISAFSSSSCFCFLALNSFQMLRNLYISNYALIDQTEVQLDQGFTVITGETGAGKSILLEALGLVLGSRANFNAIRKGQDKSVVEAVFTYKDPAVDAILRTEGLDILDDLIIRRELTRSGRSRAFINDSPVALNVLNTIARRLVDMHGQQENIALQSAGYQLQQLDLFAKSKTLLQQYEQHFMQYRSAKRKLAELEEQVSQVRKDEDYFSFQFNEIDQLSPKLDEFDALEEERDTLEHAEDIVTALGEVSSTLEGDQFGVISALNGALHQLQRVQSFHHSLGELAKRLDSVNIELDDLRRELDGLQSSFESNPNRLEEVRTRLDEYQRLMHKHGVKEVQALLDVQEEYRLKLEGIQNFDDEADTLRAKIKQLEEAVMAGADELHQRRSDAVTDFQQAMQHQVRKLGMPKAEIAMTLEKLEDVQATGYDRLVIGFDANGNNHLVSLKDSASGGEVARLMLALKSIIAANDETPTLIFDEVDTGVSGEVAKQIGSLMKTIALNAQIIAVTHLPGVAAKGQHHIKIRKSEEDEGVVSRLYFLEGDMRVEEIASMFSGTQLNKASLESAKGLLAEE
jgi:DNA repair protein RecN (Recombination protein N)